MDDNWINSFRQRLDEHYAWPALYTYKFIVPRGKEQEVKDLFPFHLATERNSKQGNYTSITVQVMMQSGDAVVEIYKKAAAIEGIVAL
jgi:putative lipoic acid-binding regulatory protein